MKLNLLIVLILAVIGYGLTQYLDQTDQLPEPPAQNQEQQTALQIAPDFTFTDTKGRSKNLYDFEGKTIILNFWASWCTPCIKEFPLLIEAAENYKDTAILLALSSDLEEAKMQNFLSKMQKEKEINWDQDNIFIAHDTESITQNVFQTYKLPETLIISPDHKIQAKLIGANWALNDIKPLLEKTK